MKPLISSGRKRLFSGLLVWTALFSTGGIAQERPVLATASVSVPLIRTLQPDGCLQPGGRVQIIGVAFGARARSVQLVSASTRLPLQIISWSDTRIEARLPAAGRLRATHYQLGLTATDGRWLGEPLNRLRVCTPELRPAEPAAQPETPSTRPQPAAEPLPASPARSAPELPSRPQPEPTPEERPSASLPTPADSSAPVGSTAPIAPKAPTAVEEPSTDKQPAVPKEPSAHQEVSPPETPDQSHPVTAEPTPLPPVAQPAEVESEREAFTASGRPHPAPAALADTRLLDMPLPSALPASVPVSDEDSEPAQVMIVTRTMAEAQAIAQALRGEGVRIKVRKPLDALGLVMSVMRLPESARVADSVARLQARFPEAVIDANHRYHLQGSDPKIYSTRQIGWQRPAVSCTESLRLGVLDTSVADTHPALAAVALTRQSFVGREAPASGDHATALAVLLAGRADTDFVSLLPGAALIMAEVFREGESGPQTTTEYLLDGLNWLMAEDVHVINMSLGGPRNRVLAWALESVMAREVAVVAAAGNSGANAPPVYPAAEPGVIAVTAVDAAARRYRHANTGDYIDVAAPGVDLWLANSQGRGSYRSGSSYATAFVSAFVAVHAKRGEPIAWAETTRDVGEQGRDDEFGWGLLLWPKELSSCH